MSWQGHELEANKRWYYSGTSHQASKQKLMRMQDWVSKLDAFLAFNDYSILENAGKITAEVAKTLAEGEYEKYRVIQDQLHQSDFDLLVQACKLESDD